MKTMKHFITKHKITMTAARIDNNPNMPDSNMDHWKCVLKHDNRRMTVYFSMGHGHNGRKPEIADVLDCISSDISSVEYTGFEEWCQDMGYDSDSRKAEKIYKACEKERDKLTQLLGSDLLHSLCYETERE